MMQDKQQANWREHAHSFKLLLRLMQFCFKMVPREMSLVMIITIVGGFSTLAVLFSLQYLIDTVTVASGTSQPAVASVIGWLAALIGIILLTRILDIVSQVTLDHVQELVKEKCQEEIISKSYRLTLADFDRPELYDRLQRINSGMDRRFFSTMTFIFRIIQGTVSILSILMYLLFVHWLIPVVLLIGSFLFTKLRTKALKEKFILHKKQTTPARKMNYLASVMTARNAAAELRLYGLKNHVKDEWNKMNDSMMKERLTLAHREYLLMLTSSGGHTLTFAAVMFGILLLAIRGALSIGQYAAFIRAVLSFQSDLNNLMWNIALVHNDLRYIDDFFAYMDLSEEKRTGLSLSNGKMGLSEIRFEKVGFNYYGSEKNVLNELDFTIRAGEKIALIGDNGSGKSTLIKLLLGLYQPVEGAIRINGIHSQELDLDDWRSQVTAIFQDFQKYHLLNVSENIAVGQTELKDDRNWIQKAAVLSGADEMVRSLTEGYETLLGKEFGGQELSQGQWQKIAIARAYIRDARLLILDEPTASLDAKSEVEVYRQFEHIAKGKTVIFISHRLGIAKLADRIIVLKDGNVEEQGSHEQLIHKQGHYAQMYQLQAQWYK